MRLKKIPRERRKPQSSEPLGERAGVGFSGADRDAAKAHSGGDFGSVAEVVVDL